MTSETSDTSEAPTFLQLLASSASLRLTCRDCSAICRPNIGKVALRVGIYSTFDDNVKIRCARCTSENTQVEVEYPRSEDLPFA